MFKKRILIDLDGVLNKYGNEKYDEYKLPDAKEGADNFLKNLSDFAELYLFTSRNLLSAAKWLIENDLDKYFADITNIKLPSYLYIDDRAVCFKGNYDKTLEEIMNFNVYWK